MGKQIYIHNSLEKIRARRIDVEKINFRCETLTVSPEAFLAQRKQARAQEIKGRLIDALLPTANGAPGCCG